MAGVHSKLDKVENNRIPKISANSGLQYMSLAGDVFGAVLTRWR